MAAQWPPRGLKPWDDALKEYVDEIRSDLEPDVTDNTAARHTHDNKALLDGIPTGGAWYQTLRRGTAGPEWVDPAGTVVPTLLVPMQGTLDGWDRSGAITATGVGALRFRDGGALVEEWSTNVVPNPVAAINPAGWIGFTGRSVARVATLPTPLPDTVPVSITTGVSSTPDSTFTGNHALIQTADIAASPSTLYTARIWVLVDPGSAVESLRIRIIEKTGVGGSDIRNRFGDIVAVAGAGWHQIVQTVTLTNDVGAVRVVPEMVSGTWASGEPMIVTAAQFEPKGHATTLIPEFELDGVTIKPGYAWTSTAHASASTRAETSITIPAASFPASLAIRYSEDMGQTWRLATLDDEGAFGNYGVVTYANGDLTFGVSERNVIIGGVRGDERALTDGEKASLLASPVWTWGGLAEGQQGPYTHPATILGAFPPNAQAAVGGATLRTAPGTTAPTIATLTEGTEVHDTGQRITESATDYAYVLTAVGQGYVDESDITGL